MSRYGATFFRQQLGLSTVDECCGSETGWSKMAGLGAPCAAAEPRRPFGPCLIEPGEQRYDTILDIGGNNLLSRLRRALTPRGRLVIVGGETDGRWLGGFERRLRAVALSPLVSQKLGIFAAQENAADLAVLRRTSRVKKDQAGP